MDPYERLANAVVKQAVDDWRLAVKKLKRRKRNPSGDRDQQRRHPCPVTPTSFKAVPQSRDFGSEQW